MATPGRALPAAHPHTELTMIMSVPGVVVTACVDLAGRAQLFHAETGEFLAHRRHETFQDKACVIVLRTAGPKGPAYFNVR